MAEAPASGPITAAADSATVVFLRPWPGEVLGDFNVAIAVLDQDGNWLGDAIARSLFSVQLPPGEHMFVSWSTNTAAIMATLSAGRVYYVELYGKASFVGEPETAMEALTPRNSDWKNLPDWLSGTRRLVPVPAAGKPYFEGRKQDAATRVNAARENWAGYNAGEKRLRTLEAEDGVVVRPAAGIR
jgi:hypothetical protein